MAAAMLANAEANVIRVGLPGRQHPLGRLVVGLVERADFVTAGGVCQTGEQFQEHFGVTGSGEAATFAERKSD